ncbi:MAG: hypothetical protein K2X86_10690 [Cytophagaceae bacterium]|nr:hypothetical protein [Cytophagaceae bacterium]
MKLLKYFLIFSVMGGAIFLLNMKEEKPVITIAFYNTENLFDTIDDPLINDAEFLPCSAKKWNSYRYAQKLNNISKVIAELGDKDGPEILGLCEVENENVLRELLKNPLLKNRGYEIVHFDSKDRRGIDVALIYKKKNFTLINKSTVPVQISEDKKINTRDILLVQGTLDKDTIFILVNHWPSRLSGQAKSEIKRIYAAKALRKTVDSIFKFSATDKIIVMGDFNDEPHNKSISEVLKAGSEDNCHNGCLINLFLSQQEKGRGTIKYKSHWNLIDQIMISEALFEGKSHRYIDHSADIYAPLWMHYKENNNNGPYRSFVGSKYYGGYSDHFPVYMHLEIK